MKNLKHILGILLIAAVLFTGCSKNNDDADIIFYPSAEDYANLQDEALESLTQNFQFNAEDGWVNLTSENGVNIGINGSCLTQDGNPVTGQVDVEFVELFSKGSMLVTNKPTMGIMPNGDKALLISGGEFFIEATQGGEALETTCQIQLSIPAELTGGPDNDMTLWEGTIDEDGNLAWREKEDDGAGPQGGNGVFTEGNQYYAFIGDFGWSNVDRFYNDPRPKTTILVDVPVGYDNTNCSVFLSYDGENTGLANLDTYDPVQDLFSEHYGQIPIGLECHVIFVTESANDWKYAIKPVTIVEDGVITITEGETSIATQAQLEAVINGLP